MKNEEKAKEIGKRCARIAMEMCSSEDECIQSAMQMAKWKDEQYKEREKGLRESITALVARLQKANESEMYYFDQCNIQKQQLIEKACEWLKSKSCCGYIEDVEADELIAQFKKAMEE